jgi:hypothetical protein
VRLKAPGDYTALHAVGVSALMRKLPCQVDSRFLEFAAVVSLGRNCLGGRPPRAS